MRPPVSLAAFGICALSLLAGSCSGGGSDTAITLLSLSQPLADGSTGGTTTTGQTFVVVGDDDYIDSGTLLPVPVALRCFWSFDVSSIPPGATVLSATFTTYQTSVLGMPYSDHGVVTLDHVDYGPGLDPADFDVPPIAPAFVTLSAGPGLGTQTVDVTARVQADVAAARPRTQFRGRFSIVDSDVDGISDHAVFTCGESAAEAPLLVVTYEP